MWQSIPKGHRPARIEIGGPQKPGAAAASRLPVDEDGLISVASKGDVTLVFIAMPMVRDRQAEIIQDKLIAIANGGLGKVAVSLSDVAVMTSAGVNALVAAHARCEALGGHLALFALSADLKRLFKVTKLDRKLVIAENAGEAVRSFSPRPRRGFFRSAFSWGRQNKDAA
jgi:anti-anti-sigma factor